MPILEITPRERSVLRSAAHPLRPVVMIGDKGLSDAVLKEIDLNLAAHGLIKVRAGGEDREAREELLGHICDAMSCAAVHHLGKVLILYRPQPGQPNLIKTLTTPESERPKRKPSEPHTPKKLAAQGKTLTKPARAPRKTEDEAVPSSRYERLDLNKAGRPVRPSTKKSSGAAAHGIPRRSGSALSLRAGARGSVQRTGAARKTVKR